MLRAMWKKHDEVKKKIHGARIPLSKRGQRVMMVFYASLPLIGGYFLMDWAIGKANSKWAVVENSDGSKTYRVPESVVKRGGVPSLYTEASQKQQQLLKEQIESHDQNT